MTIIWCMVPEIWSTRENFLSFWTFALLPLNDPENQNFGKMKKAPGDIIILHMCTINENHMYGCWDMECDRQNFWSFWTIFCPFTLASNLKNQNFEKMKKEPGDIITLHKCTKNHDHMLHYSWDTTCDRCNFYFTF